MACCNCGGDGRCKNGVHYSAHGLAATVGGYVSDMVTGSTCDQCGEVASNKGDCAHCRGSGDCGC